MTVAVAAAVAVPSLSVCVAVTVAGLLVSVAVTVTAACTRSKTQGVSIRSQKAHALILLIFDAHILAPEVASAAFASAHSTESSVHPAATVDDSAMLLHGSTGNITHRLRGCGCGCGCDHRGCARGHGPRGCARAPAQSG